MSVDLDNQARAAAAAVRSAVADLEPGPEARSPKSRRRWPAAVVAALLVAGAVGAGVVALVDDDAERVIAAEGEAQATLPRFLVDDVPDGLEPTGVVNIPAGGPGLPLRLYGRGPDDDPLLDGDVGVSVTPGPGVSADDRGERTMVRGVAGYLRTDPATGLRTLQWEERGVGVVAAATRTLDDGALLAVAEELRIEGGRVDATPPEGFDLIADRQSGPAVAFFDFDQRGGSSVTYDADEGGRTLMVTTGPGEPGTLEAARWSAPGRAVSVRGHRGWLTRDDPNEPQTVIWVEREAVAVSLTAAGLSEDELLRAAASLREATDDELARLPERRGFNHGEGTFLAAGNEGGVPWELSAQVAGVCLLLENVTSCVGGSDSPSLLQGRHRAPDHLWLYGRVDDRVATVETETRDGDRFSVDTGPSADGQGRVWVARLPGTDSDETIVAYDAEGNEVERTRR